jgi:putative transposase
MFLVIQEEASRLPVQRLCRLADIARWRYYRMQHGPKALRDPEDERLRQELHAVCAEYRNYGYRRATHELRRRGFVVGRKRVRALMHKENLRCRRKKRWIHTTNSRHGYRIYPNLAQRMHLHRLGQLWVADITYIRLRDEFVFLAVILDAYSRPVVGWAVSRRIHAGLTTAALLMALTTRTYRRGLVHHSDRGVQYASNEYTTVLKQHRIVISMSRKGNPYDNAKAESFMKMLKTEEVSVNEYDTFRQAKEQIDRFINIVYNNKRLHSALAYTTPAEFEAECSIKPFTLTTEKTVSRKGFTPCLSLKSTTKKYGQFRSCGKERTCGLSLFLARTSE